MSCFNCYSARKIDEQLIDKILVQGQRLRSAMVQSILNNDPLSEVVCVQQKSVKLDGVTKDTDQKIRAFLQGDAMSREDEIKTLETLRSMSAADLCRVTDRTYHSQEPCDCLTCVEYQEKDLKCDLKRDKPNDITQKIQEKYKSEFVGLLKFVDSLKVSINSVVLNEAGHKKANIAQTFFLEYQISEVLAKNHHKQGAKVDSGLDCGNTVRLCARRSHLQAISFKQVSVHDCDLSRIALEDASITFRLSFRSVKQKQATPLGVAKFNFSSFETSKNFACHQELALRLHENNPIVVGGLKISVQLGCGRLYFGKEFLDAATNNKENSLILGNDDLSSTDSDLTENARHFYPPKSTDNSYPKHIKPTVPKLKLAPPLHKPALKKTETGFPKPEPVRNSELRKPVLNSRRSELSPPRKPVLKKPELSFRKPETVRNSELWKPALSSRRSELSQKIVTTVLRPEPTPQIETERYKPILFGFVYISEAQFSREVMNSYLRCQMFVSEDVCSSKLVAFDSNPFYNFSQQVPVICEDDFLWKLRDNFMVVEFLEKGQKDFLIGLCKVSLHQFYLEYRNPVIVKYLLERKFPVVGTDGWDAIYNGDGEVVGQAQLLVALGTKEQIESLERERGFKNETVRAKIRQKQIDVGIQSNLEPEVQLIPTKMDSKKDIETFLNEIAQEPKATQPELHSTSDLLDSLQKALSVDNTIEKTSFKAHVVINSALHLPSRRKCKSKRSKGRKHEDILPSTYVTFEDYKGDLKITPIISKCTAPKWDFRCDVSLPVEYLTDNQKFLVFKVWRKSTNTTMTPNMNVDHVIGFATVDLTVLSAGLPSVQGWFNINDLSKKCNGQINIHVTPLENVLKYQDQKCCVEDATTSQQPLEVAFEPGELLGRALKRKFTELDEITQRLRLRLSKVTNDESDASNDEIADEFERDINTLCVEDDFDTVNFETEARNFNLNHVKEVGLLQADGQVDKPLIDQMLEKLSLLSGETSSRYVSGCSEGRFDAETIFNDLDSSSRPNLFTGISFNREMVQKFGSMGDEDEENSAKASDV